MPAKLSPSFAAAGGKSADSFTPDDWTAMFKRLDDRERYADVASHFGVSRKTLRRRYMARNAAAVRFGPSPQLGKSGEEELVSLLLVHESVGMCVSMPQLHELVGRVASDPIMAHFKGGKAWLQGFFRRHPRLSRRTAERTERKRLYALEPWTMKQYFERLGVLVKDKHPNQLWSFDEFGLDLMNMHQPKVSASGTRRPDTRTRRAPMRCGSCLPTVRRTCSTPRVRR